MQPAWGNGSTHCAPVSSGTGHRLILECFIYIRVLACMGLIVLLCHVLLVRALCPLLLLFCVSPFIHVIVLLQETPPQALGLPSSTQYYKQSTPCTLYQQVESLVNHTGVLLPRLLGWLLDCILASRNPLLHLYKPSKLLQDLAYHLSVSIVAVQTLGGDIRLNLFSQWLVVRHFHQTLSVGQKHHQEYPTIESATSQEIIQLTQQTKEP